MIAVIGVMVVSVLSIIVMAPSGSDESTAGGNLQTSVRQTATN
ncbi:hypothetical protein [Rhizobium sp. S152]|nr:hypothetical protein [Rhizobium sp. S152]